MSVSPGRRPSAPEVPNAGAPSPPKPPTHLRLPRPPPRREPVLRPVPGRPAPGPPRPRRRRAGGRRRHIGGGGGGGLPRRAAPRLPGPFPAGAPPRPWPREGAGRAAPRLPAPSPAGAPPRPRLLLEVPVSLGQFQLGLCCGRRAKGMPPGRRDPPGEEEGPRPARPFHCIESGLFFFQGGKARRIDPLQSQGGNPAWRERVGPVPQNLGTSEPWTGGPSRVRKIPWKPVETARKHFQDHNPRENLELEPDLGQSLS